MIKHEADRDSDAGDDPPRIGLPSTGVTARSSWPALASRLPSWTSDTSSTTIPVNSVVATRLTTSATNASPGRA